MGDLRGDRVEHRERGVAGLDEAGHLARRGGRYGFVARRCERIAHLAKRVRVVVDHQDGGVAMAPQPAPVRARAVATTSSSTVSRSRLAPMRSTAALSAEGCAPGTASRLSSPAFPGFRFGHARVLGQG